MKSLLILALLAGLAFSAQCLDLALKDGRVFPDVQIVNRTPDGIDIKSHQDFDIMVFRHIRYNELAPSSLSYFPDYDKAKTDDYLTSLSNAHQAAVAKNKAAYTQWSAQSAAGTPVVYPVSSASNLRIVFKATKDLENGTIGWASTEDDADQVRHFGKIFIHGLKIADGNERVGTVYLSSKFLVDRNETCPCYSTSKEDAAKLSARPN